ncbi:TadE family type IV pilus minor pilin [Dietzia sp. UCD-THP]|uniref:TadE family type IV pilus minor pilin n=1 Tax=Dietzia sp. UCD-THP TaxID=1292020 RepID=UPI0003753EDE|nr:TadE family type IV pilus minor pilin [Dietzia sp. UCD-THP]
MTASRRFRAAATGDRGSVTVEAALGIASLVVVLAVAASGSAAALTQIRVVDAAREAARVAAMSGAQEGVAAGRAAAPGAEVSVDSEGRSVTAQVSIPARGLPGVVLTGRAVARAEPGVAG